MIRYILEAVAATPVAEFILRSKGSKNIAEINDFLGISKIDAPRATTLTIARDYMLASLPAATAAGYLGSIQGPVAALVSGAVTFGLVNGMGLRAQFSESAREGTSERISSLRSFGAFGFTIEGVKAMAESINEIIPPKKKIRAEAISLPQGGPTLQQS